MRKILLLLVFLYVLLFRVFSQDTTINLNLLQSPVSPAGSLLGISPSQIDKPTDPEAFMASVKNASADFTKIPSSYAIDFAPAWLFFGNKISYEYFRSQKFCHTIWQSMVISAAVKNTSDSGINNTQFSVGLKVSLVRGKVDGTKVDDLIEHSTKQLKEMNDFVFDVEKIIQKDKELNYYIKRMGELARANQTDTKEYNNLKERAEARTTFLRDPAQRDYLAKLEQEKGYNILDSLISIAKEIKWKRLGFKLDLSGGVVFDFPNMDFKRGTATKAGAWLTGGWELKRMTFLAIVRYLYNPNQILGASDTIAKTTSFQTLDGGIRLVYNNPNDKFMVSAEALYRSVFDPKIIEPGWRIIVNAEYEVAKNIKLNLSFGKDFDGVFTKGGNVITALNLLLGFGSNKKL